MPEKNLSLSETSKKPSHKCALAQSVEERAVPGLDEMGFSPGGNARSIYEMGF